MKELTDINYYAQRIVSTVLQKACYLRYGPRVTDKTSPATCLSFDICKDWKLHDIEFNDSALFLLKFRSVKDIDVINRDDVSLYSVEGPYFIFVRADHEAGNIYDIHQYPFLANVQHASARELIKVRHDDLFKYLHSKGRVGDGSNIVYMHNSGRCGSTLVCNIVNKTGQVRVLAEPQPLMSLLYYFINETLDDEAMLRLLRYTLLLLCPDPNKKYFIKIRAHVMALAPLIHEALPAVKEIYMYRALRPAASSVKKICIVQSTVFLWLEEHFMSVSTPMFCSLWRQHRMESLEYFVVYFLTYYASYYQALCDAGRRDVRAYRYEDLIENSEEFCKKLFKDIGIGKEFVAVGVTALNTDSEKNSMLNQKSMSTATGFEVSKDALEFGVLIGKELGLLFGGDDYQFVRKPEAKVGS